MGVFERYTKAARRVVFFARYETGARDAKCISTPYILLGLYHEANSPVMASIRFRKKFEDHFAELQLPQVVRKEPNMQDIPLDDDAKKVLAWAVSEADNDGNKKIEPEHLLRGLLCFENAVSGILNSAGFDLQSVRDASSQGGSAGRLFRKVLWNCRCILLESVLPALFKLAVLFLAGFIGVLILRWLGWG